MSGTGRATDPYELDQAPNISAGNLQTAQPGAFPKEEYNSSQENISRSQMNGSERVPEANESQTATGVPPMNQSQTSMKTDLSLKVNVDISHHNAFKESVKVDVDAAYAPAQSMTKLNLGRAASSLTSSSERTGKEILGHMQQLDKMKHDYKVAKNDYDGENIKSSRIYEELLDLMRQVELFKTQDNLRGSDLDEIIQVMSIEKCEKDDIVFDYGDIGDKFFIILSGEAAVMIPNDTIWNWKEEYERYKLLLKEIEQRRINDRKEKLIAMREIELNGGGIEPLPSGIQKSMSITTPTVPDFGKSNRDLMKQSQKRKLLPSKSLMVGGPHGTGGNRSEAYIENAMQSSASLLSRSDSMVGSVDEFGAIREVDEDEHFHVGDLRPKQSIEHMSLVENASQRGYAGDQEFLVKMKAETIIADMQDRIENFSTVKETDAQGIQTMDKLMKRIKRLDKQSDRIKQPMFSGIQLDPKLLKDQPVEEDGVGTDSSMLAALGKKRAKTKELLVQDLSEKQISRLTQRQINQIVRKPVKLTDILPSEEAFFLARDWLVEFKRLTKGEFFGELALQNNKPSTRAATIKCTKRCIFGIVKKEDYRRVVGKIQQRAKTKVNSFLSSLPIYRTWTTKHLSQLQLFMEKVTYIRNQVVVREGVHPKNVYLVISGDFAFTKKVPEEHKQEVKIQKLLGPQAYEQDAANYKDQKIVKNALGDMAPQNAAKSEGTSASLAKTKLQGNYKLAVFSRGQFFGEDDFLKHRKNLGTVTCLTAKGTLFRMTTKVFETKLLSKNEESKAEVVKQIAIKESLVQDRIKMIGGIYNITADDIREEAKLEATQEDFALNRSSSRQILQQSHTQLQQLHQASTDQMRDLDTADMSIQHTSVDLGRDSSVMNTYAPPTQDVSVDGDQPSLPNDSSIQSLRRSIERTGPTPQETTVDSQTTNQQQLDDSIASMKPNKVVPPPVKLEYPPQIKTFRPINKTRKIHYPQVIKKYNIEKPQQIYIDDFRSAMKKIVKQPNDKSFLKVDENMSNFSSDDGQSHRDAKEMNLVDQCRHPVSVTQSPSMLAMNTTDQFERKRPVGSSLAGSLNTSSIFEPRDPLAQPSKFRSSVIKITQNNFKSAARGSPSPSPDAQYNSFFAKKSVDYRNLSTGHDHLSTGSAGYKMGAHRAYADNRFSSNNSPQKLTSDLMAFRNNKGQMVQGTDESMIFNPKGSERAGSMGNLHDNKEHGHDMTIRNQQNAYLSRYSLANSLSNTPFKHAVSGQFPAKHHALSSTVSRVSSLLPPVASPFVDRKSSLPLKIRPHNRFEGAIRNKPAAKKSLMGVEQIVQNYTAGQMSKIYLHRNSEELSSRERVEQEKQKALSQYQQTQKEKEIMNNCVTAQILNHQEVKYIGVAHTKRRYPVRSDRRIRNVTEKSRQILIK